MDERDMVVSPLAAVLRLVWLLSSSPADRRDGNHLTQGLLSAASTAALACEPTGWPDISSSWFLILEF